MRLSPIGPEAPQCLSHSHLFPQSLVGYIREFCPGKTHIYNLGRFILDFNEIPRSIKEIIRYPLWYPKLAQLQIANVTLRYNKAQFLFHFGSLVGYIPEFGPGKTQIYYLGMIILDFNKIHRSIKEIFCF